MVDNVALVAFNVDTRYYASALLEIEIGLPIVSSDFPDMLEIEIASNFSRSRFRIETERPEIAILSIVLPLPR